MTTIIRRFFSIKPTIIRFPINGKIYAIPLHLKDNRFDIAEKQKYKIFSHCICCGKKKQELPSDKYHAAICENKACIETMEKIKKSGFEDMILKNNRFPIIS